MTVKFPLISPRPTQNWTCLQWGQRQTPKLPSWRSVTQIFAKTVVKGSFTAGKFHWSMENTWPMWCSGTCIFRWVCKRTQALLTQEVNRKQGHLQGDWALGPVFWAIPSTGSMTAMSLEHLHGLLYLQSGFPTLCHKSTPPQQYYITCELILLVIFYKEGILCQVREKKEMKWQN